MQPGCKRRYVYLLMSVIHSQQDCEDGLVNFPIQVISYKLSLYLRNSLVWLADHEVQYVFFSLDS